MSLVIIFAFLLPLFGATVSASEYDCVEYIINNVDELADVYTLLFPDSDEVFQGKYVETIIPATIVSTGLSGTYIDFDGENGYMVVQDDSDVIKWEVSGDLKYLTSLSSTYYSIVDGFLYLDENNYIPYESEPLDSENLSASSKHEGQSLAGEGGIDDYFAYMLDRYGGSYVITDVRYLKSDFDYVRQTAYSIYNVKNSDGSISGEGNCTLSSVYALMNYLESSGTCASLPASSMFTTHKASEDSFYSKYCNDPDYSIKETITLPFLYYQIRRSAIVNYGYQVGGFFSGYNAQLIDSVAKMNSAGVDATLHTLGSFDLCVKPQIQKDKPVMFSVDLSETYGSHSLVVTGYHVYTKTTTILGINFKDYVYLLRVNDNWKAAPRYFDLTAFNGTWSYTTVEVTK